MSQDPRHARGKLGEDIACEELRRRGYAILARRFRTRAGEVDIIARDGATLVFVEVKARASVRFGSGPDAITASKRLRLVRMAEEFLLRSRLTRVPCRFDVVSVRQTGLDVPSVEVFPAAFGADERL